MMQSSEVALTTGSSRKTEHPYYVKALALGLTAYLGGVHLWTWFLNFSTFAGGNADFRQLYAAGYMVRNGYAHQLYDYGTQLRMQDALVSSKDLALPFIRPAYEALLFVPLSMVNYRGAYLIWIVINLLLLASCVWLLRPKMQNLAAIYPWLPVAMFLTFLPIAAALLQGQDSILLLVMFAGALVLLERRSDFAAGILVGLCLFKLQIVIPIALLFLAWRKWRFSSGCAVSAAVVSFASVSLVGFRQAVNYGRALLAMSLSPSSNSHPFRYPIPVNRMPNLHGLISGTLRGVYSGHFVTAISIALSTVVLIVSAWKLKSANTVDGFLIAIVASVLASYYVLIHDLSVLLIPVAILLDRFITAETAGDSQGRLVVRAATLTFVAPLLISYLPEQFYLACIPVCALFLCMCCVPISGMARGQAFIKWFGHSQHVVNEVRQSDTRGATSGSA